MNTRSPKSAQLCVVTIGIDEYLLPQAQALKLVEIMAAALTVRCDWTTDRKRYVSQGEARVLLEMVKPDQVEIPGGEITPAPAKAAPRRLTSQPLRLK